MLLRELPPIYNVDKIRIYDEIKKIIEKTLSSPRARFWELEEELLNSKVKELIISIEGIADAVILEIII